MEAPFNPFAVILAASLGVCGYVSWVGLPATAGERREAEARARGQKAGLEILARRRFFFGHAELSDLLDGLGILSDSVDAFKNAAALRADPSHPVRMRLRTGLAKVPSLAARRLGMNEVYTLPAMYFLFEEDNPVEAYEIVKQGTSDPRARAQVHLLAAFVAHVFLRDAALAGRYYETLAAKPDVPEWVGALGKRLSSGDDPLARDPKIKAFMCKIIEKSFPRARRYLAGKVDECAGREETP